MNVEKKGAAAPGENALLQSVAANSTAPGPYQVVVDGPSGSVGTYSVRVVLNAALESEGTLVGSANDTRATAQISDFITLATPQATGQRGAVLGGNPDSPLVPWHDYYYLLSTGDFDADFVSVAFEQLSGDAGFTIEERLRDRAGHGNGRPHEL